jgi:phosphate transport system permease protein
MNLSLRRFLDKGFLIICKTLTYAAIIFLIVLIYHIFSEGFAWVDWQFITSLPSRKPERAGIYTAIFGTFWLMVITGAFALPVGVCSAIFLEEYAGKSKIARFIDLNVSNLAGVPSIVYGLLGLAVFVHFFGFGRSILSGGLTLGLLVLPIIIISSRGAISSVPKSIRMAAYSLGARKWQVIFFQVLPHAMPNIMTGVIISLSRAIGETAPLIVVGAVSYVAFVPETPMDEFTALPIQIFNWTSRPQKAFHEVSAAGIIILLCFMLLMNSIAVYIRHIGQRKNNANH